MNIEQLLEDLRRALRMRRYALQTQQTYAEWARRFLVFQRGRLTPEAGDAEAIAFLNHLATEARVSETTHKQALSALKFLYANFLGRELRDLSGLQRAARTERQPTFASFEEVRSIIKHLHGIPRLVALLMYGTGMRVGEAMRLRTDDIDFVRQHIAVRNARGDISRLVPLPLCATEEFRKQIAAADRIHTEDARRGGGSDELGRAWPDAKAKTGRIFLFPAASLSIDPRDGRRQRLHLSEGVFRAAFQVALRQADIGRTFGADALRRSFAVHMLAIGADIRAIKEMLGHRKLDTTRPFMLAPERSDLCGAQIDLLPTPRHCARLAWTNRLLRSGISLHAIQERRWASHGRDYSIYCLAENGVRVRYIGITNQTPANRLRQHIADCSRGKNLYKENWLRSCVQRDVPITIHVVRSGLTAERAAMMEFELIRFFKRTFSLVNTHAGGATGYAGLSEESKEKHRVNTEKGLIASAERELEAKDLARGYCVLEEWGWDTEEARQGEAPLPPAP